MRRFTTLVKKGGKFAVGKGQKAFQDSDLLKILRSEINHELTFNQFQDENGDALGNFVIEWDSQQTQDVLLRKKSESGEEVAVSALLGPAGPGDGAFFPREVLMKVCIKKPGLSSFLQFNCQAASQGTGKSGYDIQDAYYIQSVSNLRSAYRGPLFGTLDFQLQEELKNYLEARGIGEALTNFLLLHLHKKEQDQYVNWLSKLEAVIAQKE